MTARVARFYGWTKEEIDELSYSDFLRFHRCITNLSAEETLNLLNIAAYPNVKTREAKSFYNKIKRLVNLGITKKSGKSVKDLALEAMRKMNV